MPAGTAVTPEFAPSRFDTIFFLVHSPACQQADVWQGELEAGVWVTAQDAIDHWRKGEWLVTPPTIGILNGLTGQAFSAAAANVRKVLVFAHSLPIPPIFFSPLVQMIPLKTVALPPGTHTNAYLVGGEKTYLIDPGTGLADEQERLFSVLDQQVKQGRILTAIVLSHQHPDHVEGANACAQRYGLPIYGHPITAEKLKGKGIRIDFELNEGDCLDLGTTPDGTGSSWNLLAVHTPGHAAGHLAFYESRYRLLFAGDMLSTLSSVVIAPPEGDLTIYLNSLRRLQTFDCRLLLPSHGNPSACPKDLIAESISHRLRREEQLLAILGQGPRSVADLAQELYKGLVPQLMRFAELQILAGLTKLKSEQRVATTADSPDALWKLV
jgi:glyoxylase-like metal-dependent hydrolase (beta-lactamase superfamily II)